MILRNLNLYNYKKFDQLALQIGPGLTVIKGRNEAGKSTVQDALMLSLFGDPRSRAAAVNQRRRWGRDSYFKVELEFDWDGQAFKLEKDFDAKTEHLTNICNGEELTERDAIHRRLAEMTGLGAEELFRATACVTQSNIAHINGKGKEQISDQLQSVITGGAEDTVATRAAASLQAKAADLRKGLDRPANNPGAIKEAQEYAERLKVELTAKKADLDRLLLATETVNAAGEDSEDKRRRLEAAQALLAKCEKRAKLCAVLEAASEAE
ncbi:MAG: AAA family ATPase, partial [Armatimonadota bacterium]|nr:AAA family ATPase [Armatimonadota bacterium]